MHVKKIIDKADIYINFRKYGLKYEDNGQDAYKAKTEINYCNHAAEVFISIDAKGLPYDYQRDISAETGVFVDMKVAATITGALSRAQYNPFWSRPSFERDMRSIPDDVQNILLRTEKGYLSILPICTESYDAKIKPSDEKNTVRICVVPGQTGVKKLSGVCAVIALDNDAYKAIHNTYDYAFKKGYIKTPLRTKKKLPEVYHGLGWCTWNAFYHDVTEEKIVSKMEEFREKNIPIKWIVIDDGWGCISDRSQFQITSIYEDSNKFPNGLKGCIDILKNKYHVESVGVWHSQTGYWQGIDPEGLLYQNQKNKFINTNFEYIIPKAQEAYDFFYTWHSYLREQGVDFVKIDTQGNTYEFLNGMRNCISDVIKIQEAVDESAYHNFNGNVINCMGMCNLNVNFKPYSAVMRMGDDFFPDKEDSFKEHILQNIYNSVFLSELFYCDFDMWWSKHISAKQNMILRMISGGPIYISDKIGESNIENIKGLLRENGKLLQCDSVPRICETDLFHNPCEGILRVENTLGGEDVIALFNLSDTKKNVRNHETYRNLFSGRMVRGDITLEANDAELYKKG